MNRVLASTGVMLIVAGSGWQLLVADIAAADSSGVGAIALLSLFFLLSRFITRYHAWLVPGLLVIAAATHALVRSADLTVRTTGALLGYSNAAGAFFLLACAAALLVFIRASSPPIRLAAIMAAVAFAAVPWANETAAAALLVLTLPLGLLARRPSHVRIVAATSLAAFLGTLLITVILGATYQPDQRQGRIARLVDATLTERRVMLWRDALVLIAENPVVGVGPGQFPERSPTARADRDTRWPHNEVLHLGAESGVPGLVFGLALVGWAFARLWWGAGDRGAATAVLALGAVSVHSNIDYILHFPAVLAAAAALVGAGSRLPRHAAAPFRHPARPHD